MIINMCRAWYKYDSNIKAFLLADIYFFSLTPISSHVCYIDQWEVDREFKNDSR